MITDDEYNNNDNVTLYYDKSAWYHTLKVLLLVRQKYKHELKVTTENLELIIFKM